GGPLSGAPNPDALRSALLHDLLCHRRRQFPAGRARLGARRARLALSAAGPGGAGSLAARSPLFRLEAGARAPPPAPPRRGGPAGAGGGRRFNRIWIRGGLIKGLAPGHRGGVLLPP